MNIIPTKVVGTTFEGRQSILKLLKVEQDSKYAKWLESVSDDSEFDFEKPAYLIPDTENPYDSDAISVFVQTTAGRLRVGFLSAQSKDGKEPLSVRVSKGLKAGLTYKGIITFITGGSDGKNLGANLKILEFD